MQEKLKSHHLLVLIVVFAVLGIALLAIIRAANQPVSYEAEQLDLVNATIQQDPAASEDQFVQLGGSTQPPPTFSFAAAGDFDSTDEASAVLNAIGADDLDFTLALGDLGYVGNGNEQVWCDFVTSRIGESHPFQLVAGNHDDGTSDGDIASYAQCLLNRIDGVVGEYGIEYYFDYQALMRVIMTL